MAPVIQSIGPQRPFASSADGPPAEKDTEAARGLEAQAPATEAYRAARAFESKFEGWRYARGAQLM